MIKQVTVKVKCVWGYNIYRQPEASKKYYAVQAIINNIRNDSIWLEHVQLKADKYYIPLEEMMLHITGTDITTCPCCTEGKMQFFAEIPKGRAGPPSQLACLLG